MEEFKTIEELYKRILPALRAKNNEIKRHGINYIKEEDIWNYLKETKWKNTNHLLLNDLVFDIFSTNQYELDEYVKELINKTERDIIIEI